MKYEIKQLNDTDAVVIGTGREEIKENTNTFKEGFNGDWFWCAKYNKIANNGDITAFDFKVIATIAPFKIEGLPMLELPNPAYDWFASKSYLEQHSLSDKYFESRNPSLLTNEQVTEMYKLELPNQEEDIEKLALHHTNTEEEKAIKKWNTEQFIEYTLPMFIKDREVLHKEKLTLAIRLNRSSDSQRGFIAGYKAAQKQYSEDDMKKAIEMAQKFNVDTQYDEYDVMHESFKHIYSEEQIIQSLSTQQFPTSVELTEDLQIIKWYYE